MTPYPTFRKMHDLIDPLSFLFTNTFDRLKSYDAFIEREPGGDPDKTFLDLHYSVTGITPSVIGKGDAYHLLCESYRAMRFLECLDSPFVGGYLLDAPYDQVTRPAPAFIQELCERLVQGIMTHDKVSRDAVLARAEIVLPDEQAPEWAHLAAQKRLVVAIVTLQRLFADPEWVASLPDHIDTVAQFVAKKENES